MSKNKYVEKNEKIDNEELQFRMLLIYYTVVRLHTLLPYIRANICNIQKDWTIKLTYFDSINLIKINITLDDLIDSIEKDLTCNLLVKTIKEYIKANRKE